MLKNNQTLIEKIRLPQTLKHLAFFSLGILSWLGFSFLFTLYVKIPQGRSIYDFPWHWDAPVWAFAFSFIGALLIIFVRNAFGLLTEKSKSIFRDFIILTCLIPINSLLINAFSIFVLHATYSGREKTVEFDWIMGFLHYFILQSFVALTCIGYFYLNLVNQTKERLAAAQQAKTEMELKTLQQNIEPHFLFNNLNVLSSLIESNPQRANEFLEKLSELYRYILQTNNTETVALKDELEFSRNYVYLLQERFGNAYSFVWEIDENKLNGQKIIPVSIQTLIENAVKHNAGNNENPLQISIKLDENSLLVENEKRDKPQTRPTNETGLQNLKTRYSFLTDKNIEINNEKKRFSIKLPLLHEK